MSEKTQTSTRWALKPVPQEDQIEKLAQELNVDRLVAKLLLQRGISSFTEAKDFFRPALSHLHDPFLMKDMHKAVERIKRSILNGEKIMVYGDYDVDGTTAVTLMASYLLEEYSNLITYIPDRYSEGYGISFKGLDVAQSQGVKLIIALDCGIRAIEQVSMAKDMGIDFIICDHHLPGDQIPEAVAVLDPKQPDCNYPYKELCGCGVGFKLIQALQQDHGLGVETLLPYLDLVVVAIGADIVPITGENRVLAYFGLKQINESPRVGFAAMSKPLKKNFLNITDIVFIIAPRINAAGRMEHAKYAVDLMMETDEQKATKLAAQTDQFNQDRKTLDHQTTQEALDQIESLGEQNRLSTVVCKPDWHKGVIGIVASRIMDSYYRPTLVFTQSGDKLVASARSVKGFDIHEALEGCADLLEKFGGHKYAAGLTMDPNNYADFKERFEEIVQSTLPETCKTPQYTVDAAIDIQEVNPKLYRIISQMAPFGPGNMRPLFWSRKVQDSGFSKKVGKHKDHLKLSIKKGARKSIDGIAFGLGPKWDGIKTQPSFDILYSIDINEWNGQTNLQLKVRDIK